MSREIGTELNNGAIALDVTWERSDEFGEAGIGIFLWLDSPHPFVVWSVNRRKGNTEVDAWNGSYFTSVGEATRAYIERGGIA